MNSFAKKRIVGEKKKKLREKKASVLEMEGGEWLSRRESLTGRRW